jgi:hypothetical protein
MPENYQSDIPVCVDNGGFASLFDYSCIGWSQVDGFGFIEVLGEKKTERTSAEDVLRLQKMVANIGYTLDAIVTPDTLLSDAYRRIGFTIRNAQWKRVHCAGGSHEALRIVAMHRCWVRTGIGS